MARHPPVDRAPPLPAARQIAFVPGNCGTTPMPLGLPTKDLASQPLSAAGAFRFRPGRLDIISSAAYRSAAPVARVSRVSTTRPCRSSVRT